MLFAFWVGWLVLFFVIQKRLEFYKLKTLVNRMEIIILGISFILAFFVRGLKILKYLFGVEEMTYYFVNYFGKYTKYIFVDLCINFLSDILILLIVTCVVYAFLDVLFISPYRIKYILMKDLSSSEKIQAVLFQFIPFYNQEYTDTFEDLDFRMDEVGIRITNAEDVNVIRRRMRD